MATTEYVLESLSEVESHLRLLSMSDGAGEIVSAVGNYLDSWRKERIENLQKIDGGWGPFDIHQRSEPLHGVADVARISGNLSKHCRALKDTGLEPTPELLELDLYFALAMQYADKFVAPRQQRYIAARPVSGYRHWSERDSPAGAFDNGMARA